MKNTKVESAIKIIKHQHSKSDGFLITCHFVKDGRLDHFFDYENFPVGDWNKVLHAIANESNSAFLKATNVSSDPSS